MKRASLNSPSSPVLAVGSPALAALFFFSGAIALIYEVVWQRQFALLLGSAAPATAAVLAAYFAGLGAGSYFVGRVADRWPNPLRAYAILEVLIAAGAAAAAGLLPALDRVYPWLFEQLAGVPGAFFTVKLLMAFLAIAVPTFCMGGTLPVLGRFVDHGRHRLGTTAGLLYVVNTAGAGLGALSVPLVLLPWLGIANTLVFCIAGNLVLAAWAWRLSRRVTAGVAPVPAQVAVGPGPKAGHSSMKSLFALAVISGGATFALQVFWNRAFAQIHENSVHSFAVIVAAVILALAAGAQLARFGLQRGIKPRLLLAASWTTAGVLIALGPWWFLQLTDGLAYVPTGGAWSAHAGRLLGLAGAVLIVPVTLAGVGLPAIMEAAGRNSSRPTSDLLGRILVANLAGSVAGALIAGFAAPHVMTLWQGIVLVGLTLVLAGVATYVEATLRWRPARLIAAGLVAFAVGWFGVSRLDLPRVRVETSRGEKLLSIAEGTHGITAVTERSGSRRLKLNNHYLLGGTASTGDERMQAHVPLLLHPAPRRVAFLGLGTGITAGGALFHPVEQVTAIELVPEVVAAARVQFASPNAGLLTDPRATVVVDDARNFLRGSRATFDVIIGDLVVPWRQGEGALFTVEAFAAARDSLAAGGLFCQWVPCFQLSEAELRIILRTFLSVFPRATVWRGDFSPTEPAIALIGWNGESAPDPAAIRQRLSQMKPDPANAHLVPSAIFWMHYLGSIERSRVADRDVALNTDDRPVIELLGPLRRGEHQERALIGRRLQRFMEAMLPDSDPGPLNLTANEQAGVRAGKLFEELLLLIAEGNATRAREVQSQLRAVLPDEQFKLLFP